MQDTLATPLPPSAKDEMPDSTPITDFARIEAMKENIRPLASGRSARTLSNLFEKQSESDKIIQDGHATHQKAIQEAERREKEGEEMQEGISDVLDAYNRYILFTVQHHPSSASHLLPLLESTTRRFVSDERYAQDARHLKLWVMYARHVERREEVWAFLESRDVGTKHAVFYEEWASVMEGLKRKKKADEIYRLGIARKAAPLDRLKNRHQAFLARIMAPPSGIVPDDEPVAEQERSSRPVLGQSEAGPSSVSGAVQLAPSTRLSRAPNGRKLEVFSDEKGGADDGEHGEWSELGTRDGRRKENTIEATPWKGETLPQRGVGSRTPKLEVFRDSVDKDNEAVRAADEVFSRQRPAQTEAEMLKANPLRNYDTSSLSLALPVIPDLPPPPSARKPPRTKPASTAHFVMQPWECPTDGAVTKDAKGKTERRMFAWDAVFRSGEEWSFEEIRARERGVLGKDYKEVRDWERGWHEAGASSPKPKEVPKRAPSPTVNTKLANQEVAMMFDQTIHGGKIRDSDSESEDTTSDDDDEPAAAPMSIAPTPNLASMLSPGSGMVPPTPTPAQGAGLHNRPAQSLMIFADENAGVPPSASKPAKFNIFSDTPAKTPLAPRVPSASKPKPFGVFQEEPSAPASTTPAARPRISSNPFATPATEAGASTIARPIFTQVIQEGDEEEKSSPDSGRAEKQPTPTPQEAVVNPVTEEQTAQLEEGDEHEDEPIEYNDEEEQLPIGEHSPMRDDEAVPEREQMWTRGGRFGVPRMSTISERTMEYTHVTDIRLSLGGGLSTRRTSMASTADGDEAFVASDSHPNGMSSRKSLNVVTEEEERSINRSQRVSDASEGSSLSPRRANQSGSVGSGFHLPEGYTIHGQNGQNGHTMVVTDGYDTMHTARETSPGLDTRDFVTANQQSDIPNPCNPSDPAMLAVLLDSIDPPLSQLSGLVDQRRSTSHRMDALNKFAKTKLRRNSSSANVSRSSLAPEECFALELAGKPYEVLDKIGEGGFGAVFLAADVNARDAQDDADSDDEDEQAGDCLVAIKAERPASLWESVILDRILSRLDEAAAPAIIRPRGLYAFADESFLILDYAAQGTLLDAVNKATSMGIAPAVSGGSSSFDELLAVFFTIELLRVVEDLHNANFIHGDLKIDNCLVRLDEVPNSAWSAQYTRTGADGWSDKGIKLIDFGRGIDLELFPAGTRQTFVGDWETDERDCVEMRDGKAWSYQTDYSGLASICYCMLFGKYITTEKDDQGRYKISTPLKRYWQTEMWNMLFDTLLNPTSVLPNGEQPITSELSAIRGRFEDWLEENCQKGGKSLRSMLKKIELAAITNRRV